MQKTRLRVSITGGATMIGIAAVVAAVAFLPARRPSVVSLARCPVVQEETAKTNDDTRGVMDGLRKVGRALQRYTAKIGRQAAMTPASAVTLQRLACERKQLLQRAMTADPAAARDALLPETVRQTVARVVTDATETPVTLNGVLEYTQQEFLADDTSPLIATLQTAAGAKRLFFAAGVPEPEPGSNVTIEGSELDSLVLVTKVVGATAPGVATRTSRVQGVRPGTMSMASVNGTVDREEHRVLVILGYYTDQTPPPKPTVTDVETAMFDTGAGSVRHFYEENSYGKVRIVGDVRGWYELPTPTFGLYEPAENAMVRQALGVVRQNDPSIDFRQYQHFMLISTYGYSTMPDGFSSLGMTSFSTPDGVVNASRSVVRATVMNLPRPTPINLYILAHELGHGFGNHHAGLLSCATAAIAPDCRVWEYGDHFDVMGGAYETGNGQHFNAPHKDFMGWFTSAQIETVTTSGTFTLEPLETSTAGLKAIKIPRGISDYLYVEYRQPLGYDATLDDPDVFNGALIHILDWGTRAKPALVDPSPPSYIRLNTLHLGESLTDPATGTVLRVTERSADSITVDVTVGSVDFPPAVGISTPVFGRTYSGIIPVKVDAVDPSGVERVEFFRDDVSATEPFAVDSAAPYEASIDGTKEVHSKQIRIFAKAYDPTGHVNTSPEVFFAVSNVETVPPTAGIVGPVDGSVVGNPVTLEAAADDNQGVAQVKFYLDCRRADVSLCSGTVQGYPYLVTQTLTTGMHTIRVRVRDYSGNEVVTPAATFTVDGSVPAVSLPQPASQSSISGSIDVSAVATDDTGVARVDFYRDDGVKIGTALSSPYTIVWDTTALTNGPHTLFATALDQAGKTATTPLRTVVVDNTVPTASLDQPLVGADVSGRAVRLAASASSAFSRISAVEFYRDNEVLIGRAGVLPYAVYWDTTSVSEGSHRLYVKAFSGSGMSTATEPQTVTVTNVIPDRTAPAVTVTAPADNATVQGAAVQVRVRATDPSGIASLELRSDGTELLGSTDSSDLAVSWDSTRVQNGRHTLLATAQDTAGNSASVAVTINVKNPLLPPALTVEVTRPEESATVSGSKIPINIAVSGTVDRVELFLDGGLLLGSSSTAPYALSWDTTSAANGEHTIFAKAYRGDQVATSVLRHVSVMNQVPQPSVEVNVPRSGTVVSGSAVPVEAVVNDVQPERVEFYRDGKLLGKDTEFPFVVPWDSRTATNGSHTLTVKVWTNGEIAMEKTIRVKVQNQLVVSFQRPKNASRVKGIVQVTPTILGGSSTKSVALQLDGRKQLATRRTKPFTVAWNTKRVQNGTHTLKVTAIDASGRKASAVITVRVAN